MCRKPIRGILHVKFPAARISPDLPDLQQKEPALRTQARAQRSGSRPKKEKEPRPAQFSAKAGNGAVRGSFDVANADNIDTGCRFSEEKFCEGINSSAQVVNVLRGLTSIKIIMSK